MVRSELTERLAVQHHELNPPTVKLAVDVLLAHLSDTLAQGKRIERPGFGRFSLDYIPPRLDTATGSPVFGSAGIRFTSNREKN